MAKRMQHQSQVLPIASQQNVQQQQQSPQQVSSVSPLEKLRAACLKRGAAGIKGIGRLFKIVDDDDSKLIDKNEFIKAINEYGIVFSKNDAENLFKQFDRNNDGTLNYDEFLASLRPPMSNARKEIILQAFRKMDRDGSGQVTAEDLKGVYSVRNHPKFLSGEWPEEKCFQDFLKTFDSPNSPDAIITEDEFMNYYSGVSASIDSDAYFCLMMQNSWKL